jgi:hypothetical protein
MIDHPASSPAAGDVGARGSTPAAGTTAWERAKQGWPARYPIVQFPNAPLLVAFAGLLVAVLTEGSLHGYARAVFFGGLAVWAWLEVTDGVNWPRRVLGGAGLGYFVVAVGQSLA